MSIRFEKDFDDPAAHYSLLEGRYADDAMIGVVLLGADSEVLRRAHRRSLRETPY
jgi:hypothetical protein